MCLVSSLQEQSSLSLRFLYRYPLLYIPLYRMTFQELVIATVSIASLVKPSLMLSNKVHLPHIIHPLLKQHLGARAYPFLHPQCPVQQTEHSKHLVSTCLSVLKVKSHWSILFCIEGNSIVQKKQNTPDRPPHQPSSSRSCLTQHRTNTSQIKLNFI